MVRKFEDKVPHVDETAYVDVTAVVIGDVEIKAHATVWPHAVIRGDVAKIVVGENTSVQDNSVLHTTEGMPLLVSNNVVIGHNANLHSCSIGEGALIGIGSIVLDGAVVGKEAYVGAGTLVPPRKEVPDGMLMLGVPGKIVREVTEEEKEDQRVLVEDYVEMGQRYLAC